MFRTSLCVASLSIVLIACGDSATDTPGTGGSAGAGGASGAGGTGLMGDACLDDLGILAGIEDIAALVTQQCLLGTRACAVMEVPQCVAECLEEEVGLPQDCGVCVGLVTNCILRDCIGDCTNPESPACDTCVAEATPACNEVFEPCGGFVPP